MDNLMAIVYSYGPLLLMLVIFYFFLIKPQKKKDQEILDMRNKLEVGDHVVTIGGIIGRIVAVRDDQVTLETGADRVKMYFAKWAVQGKTDAPKD